MIIEQTTAERNQEIHELFESIKPILDEGYSFNFALQKIGKLPPKRGFNINHGWGKDLIEYARTRGYDYHDYKYMHPKNALEIRWEGTMNMKKATDKMTEIIESCWDENNPWDWLTFDERLHRKMESLSPEDKELMDEILKFE